MKKSLPSQAEVGPEFITDEFKEAWEKHVILKDKFFWWLVAPLLITICVWLVALICRNFEKQHSILINIGLYSSGTWLLMRFVRWHVINAKIGEVPLHLIKMVSQQLRDLNIHMELEIPFFQSFDKVLQSLQKECGDRTGSIQGVYKAGAGATRYHQRNFCRWLHGLTRALKSSPALIPPDQEQARLLEKHLPAWRERLEIWDIP